MSYQIREALPEESAEVAELFRRSRLHFLPYLPILHSVEEDREYFRETVFVDNTVNVAVHSKTGRIIGFIAFESGHLNHLYIAPEHVRCGLGEALLETARIENDSLELWVFQQNEPAIAFYRKHGFEVIKSTDGADNEERCPDHKMLWSSI